MHISLHYPFAKDKQEFSRKIQRFFDFKNIDINTFDQTRHISIEIA